MYFIKRAIIASKRDYKLCLAGKMKELFIYKTDIREEVKRRKLYCNILKIRHRFVKGYYYYLLLIDNVTRTTWVRLFKDKSIAIILLILTKLINII